MVHLFTTCTDLRSRPLRDLGLRTADSVRETLGGRALEMAKWLIGSG